LPGGPIRFQKPARTPEPAAGTLTSGHARVVQMAFSRAGPLGRQISVDCMRHKDGGAKQAQDYRDRFDH